MMMPVKLSPNNEDELLTLTRMLKRSRGGFALAFARCNSPAERHILVEQLRASLNAIEISVQALTLTTAESIISQLENVPGQNEGQPVFIYGIEYLLPSDQNHSSILAQLNERREKFQKLIRPLVFWLPDFAMQEIAAQAGDFWAWRSGVYVFETILQTRLDYTPSMSPALSQDINLSTEEKNARLDILQKRDQDFDEDNPVAQKLHARNQLSIGFLHQELGNLEYAMQSYQKALKIYDDLSDLKYKAITLKGIASIFVTRGDLSRAMALYHDALEVDDNLGSLIGKADTLAMSAQAAVLQEDYKKALADLFAAREIAMQGRVALSAESFEKNIITLKSITGPAIFTTLWTDVTGQHALPEWLMETKKMTEITDWVKLFLDSELPEGKRKLAKAGSRRMIILRFKGNLYAIESNCPHLRFPLEGGSLTEDGGIICPFHHSAFDLATGNVKEWSPWPPGLGALAGAIRRERVLVTFPVKSENGYIWASPRPQNT